ncbi:RNA recognition motif-containing protein [Paramarasmius palmivorus]|uniref:RNA recognition motif-containing protein n=1 Tax=Paramarasmius palmivorus TaxID=297713 RepID=A0AAW0C8Z1_9AGAR
MASSLGKRKDREEDSNHGSTLFVSNLPYTATSVDLQTLFSDIAPVRSAFVVTEHGTGVSKGVGYVSFSIREDAKAAYEKISEEGITLVGRNLRVQWAENKHKEKGAKEERVKKETKARPLHQNTPQDPLAIRTIVVSGLPSSADSKTLWKKFRKYAGAEKVEWPVKSENGEESDTAHVIFDTPAHANDAVTKLHAHIFKGSLLSVALKKRLDNLRKPVFGQKPDKQDKALPSHAGRLIVRNIPFNTTEQDLRAVFLPYGPIHSIHIPTEKITETNTEAGPSSPKKKSRSRGFAFIWMLSKKDAERALEACNGITIRAGMAEGMVEDKQKRKKQKRMEKKQKAIEANTREDDEEPEDDETFDSRMIAVDWALSKDKWEEEKVKLETEQDEDAEMKDNSESDDSEEGNTSDSDEGDSDAIGLHEGDSDEGSGSDEDSDYDEDDAPVKPELPPPDAGTTLFVRNVPFTATEDELRTLTWTQKGLSFRSFGPLRYARITMDPETGRSRGTGFACFWNKEDADKAIEQSELLKAETIGNTETHSKNPFTLPSLLTPDPSSSLARSLVLHGRTLDVVRAVTRTEAGKLREEGEKRRQKADKRNMYLLREGVILPNTPAAETVSPADLERRTTSFSTRKNLLKSNPSLYISKTRLSIRQIPLFVTDHMLKRLALHAVKAFNAEFKNGERKGLTADELAEMDPEPQDGADSIVHAGKGKGKMSLKNSGVKQAKIVRQQERVDPVTGKGRSKGYGFVEMYKHADALRVLRWCNNNPAIGPLFTEWWKDEVNDLIKREKAKDKAERNEDRIRRLQAELDDLESGIASKKSKGTLIVEFSIENVQVVKRRDTRQKESVEPSKDRTRSDDISKDKPSPLKKPRLTTKEVKDEDEKKAVKTGQKIGSLIGRKRKQRKMAKR